MDDINQCRAENASPTPEVYIGDAIESIRFFGHNNPNEVNIRLKNGQHISITSKIEILPRSLEAKLEVIRGFWGVIPDRTK
jgi:hypothetical protein